MAYRYRAKTKDTLQRHRETYWPIRFQTPGGKVLLLIQVALVGVMLYAVCDLTRLSVTTDRGYIEFVYLIAGWLLTLLLLFRVLFQAQIAARKKMKENDRVSGKTERASETLFYEDRFCFHSAIADTVNTVPYSEVSKIKETKNFYLIFTKNRAVCICEKAGFEGDRAEEAYQFLCSKVHS